MINKVKLLGFIFVLILMVSTTYASIHSEGAQGHGGEKLKNHRLHQLNLTQEQQDKLKELRDTFRKETVFLRNNIKVKRMELQTLWTVPQPEKDKILAKQKELMDLVVQLQMKAVDFRLTARSYLSPEQAAQAGILASMKGPRSHRGGRMMTEQPY